MPSLRPALLCPLIAGIALVTTNVLAQPMPWPTAKPIRIVVAYPAGGVSDVVARALGEKLSEDLKAPVVIENRAGAAGNIGMDAVAKAAPDGYTFGFASISPLTLNPHLMKATYDPYTDIAPVVSVMYSPILLVATPAASWQDMAGMIEAARKAPGTVTWATSGKGSVGHIMVEQVMRKADVTLTDIPYKGAGQQMQDALGGQFSVMSINSSPAVAAQIEAGKLRPLAVGAPQRLSKYGNVPTFTEVGFAPANMTSLFGLYAPAQTSPAILEQVNAAVNRALKDPKVVELLESSDNVATGGTAQAFAQDIKRESDSNARIIKEANIQAQ